MKIWVAEIDDGWTTTKFELCESREKALHVAASMMVEQFGIEGDACEGEGPTRFITIEDHGGQVGLTKILCVRGLDEFEQGAPEAAIYEKEVLK
jgi:hypothetical protein